MALNLKGKTIFITGASRGIGKAIGLRAARDGANVVIAAKTAETHPKLEGTIYSAKEEIEAGKLFETLMGNDVSRRRQYLLDNSDLLDSDLLDV